MYESWHVQLAVWWFVIAGVIPTVIILVVVVVQLRRSNGGHSTTPAPAWQPADPPEQPAASVGASADQEDPNQLGILGSLVALAICAGLLILGVYVLGWHSPIRAAVDHSLYAVWPKAAATVVDYDRKGYYKSSGRFKETSVKRVYRFELDGRVHEGRGPDINDSISAGGSFEFPVGTTMIVAYNPWDPGYVISAEDADAGLSKIGGLILGGLPAALGGAGVVHIPRTLWRRWRRWGRWGKPPPPAHA